MQRVVVVGLGEIGRPILELVSSRHTVMGVDIEGASGYVDEPDVLHICYPFEIPDFVGETVRYITLFRPALTVIHSTVAVGTTRAVAVRSGRSVVNSPVRGKHARMVDDLRYYTKFIGALDEDSAARASAHFESVGLSTKVLISPEATELAKLTETTYFGILIGWAQEVERYCDAVDVPYAQIVSFYKEIGYLPRVEFFPGVIGGHCVMPNIAILERVLDSEILEAIRTSNSKKIAREADIAAGRDDDGRLTQEPAVAGVMR